MFFKNNIELSMRLWNLLWGEDSEEVEGEVDRDEPGSDEELSDWEDLKYKKLQIIM